MSYSTCGKCGEVISLSPCKCNQVKTLTDEEILVVVERNFGESAYDSYFESQWIDFARAILLKAQEK
jgi:hypothetical protein